MLIKTKAKKEKEKGPKFYMLWETDNDKEKMRRIHDHVSAPKRDLPGEYYDEQIAKKLQNNNLFLSAGLHLMIIWSFRVFSVGHLKMATVSICSWPW